MAAVIVAEGPGTGALLVGYQGHDAGWKFDPGLGWVATSTGAQLRRGMWRHPSGNTSLPADFPGDHHDPPELPTVKPAGRAPR